MLIGMATTLAACAGADNDIIVERPLAEIYESAYAEFNDEEYDFSLEPADSEFVELNKSNGRICAEFVYAYPPGIPILFPNALITSETIHMISELRYHGVNLTSTGKLLPRSILTKKE